MPPPQQHLLLLPGLLCSPRLFDRVLAALPHALTGRGVDPASVTVSVPPTHTHADVREVAAHLLATAVAPAGARLSIAGFSYGGYVALEMAHQAPHRVRRLALLSSQARPDSDVIRARRAAQVERAVAEGGLAGVLLEQLPKLLHPSHLPPGWEGEVAGGALPSDPGDDDAWARWEGRPAERGGLVATVARMAAEVGVRGFAAQQAACAGREDRRDAARAVARGGAPTLLCFGREDHLIPLRSHTQLFDELLAAGAGGGGGGDGGGAGRPHQPGGAHAHPVLLRELGRGTAHMPPLERPTDVAAALADWMARPAPGD